MFEDIPHSAVIVLAGVAGSGKSTWARERFPGVHILSSDQMRGFLTDDDEHRECSSDAFEMLEAMADLRLKYGRLVILDATNLRRVARKPWIALAKKYRVPAILFYFDVPVEICARRQERRERKVPLFVIQRQHERMQDLPQEVVQESWDAIGRLHIGLGAEEDGALQFEPIKRWEMPRLMSVGTTGVRIHHRALDIIGDVHGCHEELLELLSRLGWRCSAQGRWEHPDDRMLIFVGDLTDRGPNSVGVLELVASLVEQEKAVLVKGNHDDKLERYFAGRDVKALHGLETTIAELEALDPVQRRALRQRCIDMFANAPLWALCDPEPHSTRPLSARLVVSHAAWKPSLLTRSAERTRSWCIYGPTTGKTRDGLPERLDWTASYPRDAPLCVHGHTAFDGPVEERNNTLCIDTGCVFGARLSALRWPTREVVQVEARRAYYTKSVALERRPRLIAPEPSDEPAKETAAMAVLGVGPKERFDLRIDHLFARVYDDPVSILGAIDADPLLLKKVPSGFDGAEVRQANASRELFSPQQDHHLYAKGIVYARRPLRLVSVPYLKMYNYGEREDARELANSLAATRAIRVRFNEKLDGSMVQSFSTAGLGLGPDRVVLTTRGMMEGARPSGHDESGNFDYLGHSRRLLDELAPAALDPERVQGLTLLWEFIHPEVRIVTDYGEREEIVLTGAVDYRRGPPFYLDRAALEVLAEELECPIAPELELKGADLDARLAALERYLEGTDREGAVLTFEGRDAFGRQAVLHRVKVKGADYIKIMRQLTYCTYDRARAILDAPPQIQSWDEMRDYLVSLGSDQVPEEVLSAWRGHFVDWQSYRAACEALAQSVNAYFDRFVLNHPMPDRETVPKAYGVWRRDFASMVRQGAQSASWLLFLAADGRMSFDGLNKKLRGSREGIAEAAELWREARSTLEHKGTDV